MKTIAELEKELNTLLEERKALNKKISSTKRKLLNGNSKNKKRIKKAWAKQMQNTMKLEIWH